MTSRRRVTLVCGVLLAAAGGCREEPADPHALLTAQQTGLGFLRRGQLPEAETQFRKVAELAPKDPTGHANLGLTYLQAERYTEAESALRRARRLNPRGADVGLILAKLYAVTGRADDARATLEELSPEPKVLYALAELAAQAGDSARRATRLRELLRAAPANLAVRLQLAEALARNGAADSAAAHLEEIRRLRPEPPAEARRQLDSALHLLRGGNTVAAHAPLARFIRLMEVTAPYQASLDDVRWVEGPLVGRPVLAFNPQSLITTRGLIPLGRSATVRFIDATGEVGFADAEALPTALAMGDYDGDGGDDLFVSGAARDSRQGSSRMYHMRGGYVTEVTPRTGMTLPGALVHATFADTDNDGWLDLFAIDATGRAQLLRNDGTGRFVNATARAGVGDAGGARNALFLDLDHDGDLDLLFVGGTGNPVYRNNLDGTFTPMADAFALTALTAARDVAFGDLDGDGRTDLVVAARDGALLFYRGTSLQRFEDATAASGIASPPARSTGALVVGDYNNDGALDILAPGASGGPPTLWRNDGRGVFSRDDRAMSAPRSATPGAVRSATFLDYDNDGWLDLLTMGAGGTRLFHNDKGAFRDRTEILPPSVRGIRSAAAVLAVSDVDADGDQDVVIGDSIGVHLLRNDGGNANLAMDVQLLGARTGSGKNNTFGVGSRIEVRAGALYQTRVATGRTTHFGLGPHLKADVVRIEWTNGVPQTIYFPGTDQDVVELEALKGSCAFLYTWDGRQFRFVTDVMWRSALGMPLGIMGAGAAAAYAPAGASQEYLRIPGDALQPRDGRYVLQFTEELWETAYLDEIRLLAVDHPDSVEVYVDERFVPPAPVQLRLFQTVDRRAPRSAVNERGADVLPAVRERDDVYVGNFTPLRYQGLVEPHELVLDLGPDAGRAGSLLVLRGWIYPTDASINVALGQQRELKSAMPSLEVRNARGQWQTAIPSIGFPSGKDKTIVIELAGLFKTADHRVRIRTNMRIHWDHAFVARAADAPVARTTPLRAVSADLHYRGFSRMYRRGGANGPHWFAYHDVTAASPWRTIEGAFTRFGNVLPLIERAEDMYVVMAPGDEVTVQFDAASANASPPGWKRTFLLYTDGWIKDADLNTAHGNTVEPLPFHAIRQYPYGAGESYPADTARARYRREYNTRLVRRPERGIRGPD